jgi:hypothetical protein
MFGDLNASPQSLLFLEIGSLKEVISNQLRLFDDCKCSRRRGVRIMQCPNCGEARVEAEYFETGVIPSAILACPSCAGEWLWIKGKGLRQLSEPTDDLFQMVQKLSR